MECFLNRSAVSSWLSRPAVRGRISVAYNNEPPLESGQARGPICRTCVVSPRHLFATSPFLFSTTSEAADAKGGAGARRQAAVTTCEEQTADVPRLRKRVPLEECAERTGTLERAVAPRLGFRGSFRFGTPSLSLRQCLAPMFLGIGRGVPAAR